MSDLINKPSEEDYSRLLDKRKASDRGMVNAYGIMTYAVRNENGEIWYWSGKNWRPVMLVNIKDTFVKT